MSFQAIKPGQNQTKKTVHQIKEEELLLKQDQNTWGLNHIFINQMIN